MKKLFLAVFLIISPFLVNAQLKDTRNQELNRNLKAALTVKGVGIITTVTGFTLLTIGIVKFLNSPTECEEYDPTPKRCHMTEVKGKGLMATGAIVTAVGLPVLAFSWHGKIKLLPFIPSASVNGIGLEIRF